jgi:hypothetical protein
MRYIGALINQIGRETKNPRSFVTSTSGVSDDEILEYLNDAQNRLFATILTNQGMTRRFDFQTSIPVVAGQIDYDLPARSGWARGVRKVELWRGQTFYKLDPMLIGPDWDETVKGDPSSYVILGDKIRLSCVPTSGVLKVWASFHPANLDKRRGKIASLGTGSFYTSITLANDTNLDEPAIMAEGTDFYVTICDKNGVITHSEVPVDTYTDSIKRLNLTIGVVPLTPAIAVGDFVTIGKYSTTHCSLSNVSDIVETFLKAYAVKKLNQVDSSTDIMTSDSELKGIASQIFELVSAEYSDDIAIGLYNSSPWLGE